MNPDQVEMKLVVETRTLRVMVVSVNQSTPMTVMSMPLWAPLNLKPVTLQNLLNLILHHHLLDATVIQVIPLAILVLVVLQSLSVVQATRVLHLEIVNLVSITRLFLTILVAKGPPKVIENNPRRQKLRRSLSVIERLKSRVVKPRKHQSSI